MRCFVLPVEFNVDPEKQSNLRDYLIKMRKEKDLSYDWISKRCSELGYPVSKSTVAEYFANPDYEISAKKLDYIRYAVTSFDPSSATYTEELPLKPEENADYMKLNAIIKHEMILGYRERCAFLEKQNDEIKAEIRELRSSSRDDISAARSDERAEKAIIRREKHIWMILCFVLVVLIGVLVIVDFINPSRGWLKRGAAAAVTSATYNAVNTVFKFPNI